ncbi:MAG: ribosome maturation factor RimP [Thermodesulfobacteriota bacterium]
MSDYVVEKIEGFAQSLLPSMDLELVEIQYRMEGHGWVLRLFIDGPDGVSIDQCAEVSREVSTFLDVEDCIPNAYALEVSSPGLERPLRKLGDFERYVGEKARIKLRYPVDEQKVFIGLLGESDEESVELLLEDGSSKRFLLENIRKARLTL